MDKLYCSWNDIDLMIRQLWEQIQDSQIKFDVIVGIKNGGLNISNPLATMLGLSHRVVYINYYDDEIQKKEPFIFNVNFELDYWNSPLIVDDVIDSGKTIRLFKKYFGGNIVVATLFWKKDAIEEPDFYVREKFDDWLVFPWEV